jgi:hypothetical protein
MFRILINFNFYKASGHIKFLPFIFILTALNFYSIDAEGQAKEIVFGKEGADIIKSSVVFNDSTYYFTGFSYDPSKQLNEIALHHLDKEGQVVSSTFFENGLSWYGLSINPTLDGNLIICGETQTHSNGLDIVFLKVSPQGSIIWKKILGGPLNESAAYVTATSDSGYVFAGFKNDQFGSNDIYAGKLDKDGNLIWDILHGDIDNDYASMVLELPEGGFILTGDSRDPVDKDYKVRLVKITASGEIIWSKLFGDDFQNGCQGIMLSSDGYFISYGETEVYRNSPFDFYIQKIDSAGNSIWRKTYGGDGSEAAFSMVEDENGDFVVSGYVNSQGSPLDVLMARVSKDGQLLWKTSFGGSAIDIGFTIKNSGNNFIIGGFKTEAIEQNYVIIVPKELTMGVSGLAEIPGTPSLTLWPNPATDFFMVKGPIGIYSWELLSISGQVVAAGKESSTEIKISAKGLNPGVYFFKVVSSEGRNFKKIIITN